MKSIKCDLPDTLDDIELHIFADLHIGDKNCNMKLIRERIEYVKNTKNAYCVLNGDLMNNATKTSVSDSYSEQLSPDEQIDRCVELFGPIKDKIICITSGNHEKRTYRKEGVDITKQMVSRLNLTDKYSSSAAIIFVRFGSNNKKKKICYSINMTHGSGGGRKEGAKAIRLADMASIIDADVYIHSHTHLPMVMKQRFARVSLSNSSFAYVDKLFVNTAATLEFGGYGEEYEFKPASTDTPVIYLDGHKKGARASL